MQGNGTRERVGAQTKVGESLEELTVKELALL